MLFEARSGSRRSSSARWQARAAPEAASQATDPEPVSRRSSCTSISRRRSRPETLLEIAKRNGEPLPADTVEGLRELYRFRDFDHFIEVWILTTNCLRTEDDFRQVVVDYAARGEAARRRLPRGDLLADRAHVARRRLGRDLRAATAAAPRTRASCTASRCASHPDITRSAPARGRARRSCDVRRPLPRPRGRRASGWAARRPTTRTRPFAPAFRRRARRRASARSRTRARWSGPSRCAARSTLLEPDRIRHGFRAIEDPALVEELAERGLVLDVTPDLERPHRRGRLAGGAPAPRARRAPASAARSRPTTR